MGSDYPPKGWGFHSYHYVNIMLIMRMALQISIGTLLLGLIFFIRYGKTEVLKMLLGILPLYLLMIVFPIFVFLTFLFFILFVVVHRPHIYPEGHPYATQNLRGIPIKPSSGFSTASKTALHMKCYLSHRVKGKKAHYLFPCPLKFPSTSRYYHKLMNMLEISIPSDIQDREVIRLFDFFKEKKGSQKNYGDIYLEFCLVDSRKYYFILLLVFLGFLVIALFYMILIRDSGFITYYPYG